MSDSATGALLFPAIRYRDAAGAIDWLCAGFDWVE